MRTRHPLLTCLASTGQLAGFFHENILRFVKRKRRLQGQEPPQLLKIIEQFTPSDVAAPRQPCIRFSAILK